MAKPLHMFMLILFILLVIYVLPSTFATKFSSLNQSLSYDDECLILFQFKLSMSTYDSASSDPRAYSKVASWKLNTSEGMSADCCLWKGLECNGKSSRRRVIGLDLSSSFLYGSINSNTSLFDLIHLRTLNLADNDFHSSQIPSRIRLLSMLTDLNLSVSNFKGHVPNEISHLNQLASLDLHHNYFRGRIPSLETLLRLNYLDLSDNGFDGRNLSVWLGKLPNLSVLDLEHNNLSCEIPSSIGNQTQLTKLYLGSNRMFGQIPSSLTNLTQITDMSLGNNEFIGSLPSLETLSNLKYLYLGSNTFDRWKLPAWFGNLNKLLILDLHLVNLYGEMPSLFFNLTQLEALTLARNQLRGPIPSSLSNLINVEFIGLYSNKFTGTLELDILIPLKKLKHIQLGLNSITVSVRNNQSIENLPKFKSLGLSSCNLRVFPDFLRFQNQLEVLELADNKFHGVIPEWMGNISKETLQHLLLGENSLTGFEHDPKIVPWVGLKYLNLSFNMLHGSIAMPPPTTRVYLISNNNMNGEIPSSICDLQSLQIIDLSFNNITGNIPPCLEKLSNSLLVLDLRGNSLRGTIPDTFFNGSKLQIMDLSENELEGQIPRSLENCASLQMLDLGSNHLEGMFPYWLGALPELQVLILRINKFHGSIRTPTKSNSKFPKLQIIDLSYNSFSGDLPYQYFQELPAMKKLESDVAYMQVEVRVNLKRVDLVFTFRYSMSLINKGVTMEYKQINNLFIVVDLSSNKFRGTIPESIESLGGLQLLNLSNNELSGVIPSSIGNLSQLESLDLSRNKLTGEIPQQLLQLNFLAVLNVSYNNLNGPIPHGRHFDTFSNISYIGNPALCGVPLSKECGKSEASEPLIVSVDEATQFADFPSGVDWVVILLGVGSGLVIGLLFGSHLTTRCYKVDCQKIKKVKR